MEEEILKLLKIGYSVRYIRDVTGCSKSFINRVKNRSSFVCDAKEPNNKVPKQLLKDWDDVTDKLGMIYLLKEWDEVTAKLRRCFN
jgi:hypothetical protein